MPLDPLIARPAGLDLPGAYGSAMKLADMKSQYDYEPRKRQFGEALALAQIQRLHAVRGQKTADRGQSERHHKEAAGLARGLLAVPPEMRQQAYVAMRQQAIDLGHPNASQLPEQWTPELLPGLRVLASGMPAEERKAVGTRVDPNVYDVNQDEQGGTDSDMAQRYGGDGGPGGTLGDPLPGPASKRNRRRGKDRRR